VRFAGFSIPDLFDAVAAYGEVAAGPLFAIALFYSKHSDIRFRWALVEEEAISFLETLSNSSQIDSLIAAIQSSLT
jgi:hypothetical protein